MQFFPNESFNNSGKWGSLLVSIVVVLWLAYKFHDITEYFALGHPRWSDAYTYWFAMMHLESGLETTRGLLTEGIDGAGYPFFYLSAPPLHGLVQAAIVALFDGAFWSVRIFPIVCVLIIAGLTTLLAARWVQNKWAVLAICLLFGMPYVLKYGSNNEGFQFAAIALSLVAWFSYFKALDGAREIWMFFSVACIFIGLLFNWLVGLFALPLFVHLILTRPCSFRNVAWAFAYAASIVLSVALVLIHQGLASGEWFYPLTRAAQRAGDIVGMKIEWSELAARQAHRYWIYYGQVPTLLCVYWLLRRMINTKNWSRHDIWLIALWMPGLGYGFMLKSAAWSHDYLMLGFLPGAVLIATVGASDLFSDISNSFKGRYFCRVAGILIVFSLMSVHFLVALRTASHLERLEAKDLLEKGAAIAPFLNSLPDDFILIGDASSAINRRTQTDGEGYAVLRPYMTYLTRNPVRFAETPEALARVVHRANSAGLIAVLIQVEYPEKKLMTFSEPTWTERKKFDQEILTIFRPM